MALTNTTELAEFVRKWVHYDQLAGTLSKQASNARKARDTVEGNIIEILTLNNMRNAILQTNVGRLTIHEEKHAHPLTLQRLEALLHAYYKEKRIGAPDETSDILSYIRNNRGSTVETKLKKN